MIFAKTSEHRLLCRTTRSPLLPASAIDTSVITLLWSICFSKPNFMLPLPSCPPALGATSSLPCPKTRKKVWFLDKGNAWLFGRRSSAHASVSRSGCASVLSCLVSCTMRHVIEVQYYHQHVRLTRWCTIRTGKQVEKGFPEVCSDQTEAAWYL